MTDKPTSTTSRSTNPPTTRARLNHAKAIASLDRLKVDERAKPETRQRVARTAMLLRKVTDQA